MRQALQGKAPPFFERVFSFYIHFSLAFTLVKNEKNQRLLLRLTSDRRSRSSNPVITWTTAVSMNSVIYCHVFYLTQTDMIQVYPRQVDFLIPFFLFETAKAASKTAIIFFLSLRNRVLRISNGLGEPGPVNWDLALCLLLAWIICYLCVCKGVKSSGKVRSHKAVNLPL